MVERKKSKSSFWSFKTLLIVIVLLFAIFPLLFRAVLWQPFNIPAGSMKPTLLVGDYVFVSKYAYGYSRFSFPLGIVQFDGRIFPKGPARGDIAVFRLPRDNRVDYIKRVIGLPGDEIQMRDGQLFINGEAVPKTPVEAFKDVKSSGTQRAPQYVETLPNGVSYRVLDIVPDGAFDNTSTFRVPDGHYFMIGDNRDNSTDSRLSDVGMVPFENLVGRTDIIFWSNSQHGESRAERILMPLR